MNRKLLKAWRFFMEHDGYATPPGRAVCALHSARVDLLRDRLEEQGRVSFRWVPDESPDHPREWGWSAADVERWDRTDHECEGCILVVDGEETESLWGIWDAGPEYRRCIEKDLLAQYIATQGTDLVPVQYPGGTVMHRRQRSFGNLLT